MNTYWQRHPRKFANEYTLAVATDDLYRDHYRDADFTRVTRAEALKAARYRGDAATEVYVVHEVDAVQVYRDEWLTAVLD